MGAGDVPQEVAVSPTEKASTSRTSAAANVSQYDVGAGGALAPKSPATVAAGITRTGWR